MSIKIISQNDTELTLQVKVKFGNSIVESEENIVKICNEIGALSTQEALKGLDANGSPIVVDNRKYTSKTKDRRAYQTPYGEVYVERHVYQSSSGGEVYVPLEYTARIINGATPRFAKMLSQKYSCMSAQEVLNDLETSNERKISKKYLQNVSASVSDIIQTKTEWEYSLPAFDSSIESVAISMDGAMLPMCNGTWRESMVGVISLYDKKGDKKHSIYIAESPEYGKKSFMERLEKEVTKIKAKFPNILYLGIADGAKNNWTFLEHHTDKQLLDFYHVTEYLAKASYAAHPEKTGKQNRINWLNAICHKLKHYKYAPKNILKELKRLNHKKKLTQEIRKNLNATITYFTNNIHRMNYAEHTKNNLPIGSGVTEAGCKTLVKQRFCRSGMRWKDFGIKVVLRLRELLQTTGRWQQLWQKINLYGISYAT